MVVRLQTRFEQGVVAKEGGVGLCLKDKGLEGLGEKGALSTISLGLLWFAVSVCYEEMGFVVS